MSGMVRKSTRGVARIVTISRPAEGNALDRPTIEALTDAFDEVDELGDIRILFLRGAGGVFCLGETPSSETVEDVPSGSDMRCVSRMLEALRTASVFSVALVDGPAVGLGAALAVTCDSVFVTPRARIGFPETRSGLIPAVAAPYVMDAIGAKAARRLLVFGRTIGADEAVQIGLAQRVVSDATAMERTIEDLLREVRHVAPGAARAARRLTTDLVGSPFDLDVLEESLRRIAIRRKTAEAAEGQRARRARLPPKWLTA